MSRVEHAWLDLSPSNYLITASWSHDWDALCPRSAWAMACLGSIVLMAGDCASHEAVEVGVRTALTKVRLWR